MQRQTILETIQRHLRVGTASIERDQVGLPLSEIVGRVARELRREKPDPSTVVTVIPIEQVAAFVDGNLDQARVDAVCRAVLVDNGVLAELIAAVRATQSSTDALPPVSESLTERLLATHPAELISSKDIARMMYEPETRARKSRMRILIPSIMAAAIASIVYLNRDSTIETSQPLESAASQIVAEPTIVDALTEPDSDASDSDAVGSNSPAEQTVATPKPASLNAEIETSAKATLENTESADGNSTIIDSAEMEPPVAPPVEPTQSDFAELPATEETPDKVSPPKVTRVLQPAPKWSAMRWTDIAGIIGTIERPIDPPTDASPDDSDNLKRRKIRRVMAPSTATFDEPVNFHSLRFSRGIAAIETELEGGGGEILIDEDSIAMIAASVNNASAQIDVRRGSIAIRNVPEHTGLVLRRGATPLGMVVFDAEATVLIHAIAGGMELHLQNAMLKTDEGWFVGDAVRLTAGGTTEMNNLSSLSADWMNNDPVMLDKVVMSQIGESTDLIASIDAQINRLAGSSRLTDTQSAKLSQLVQMRLSLAGDRLFSMVTSQFEVVRVAAVEAIALLPKNDPRFEPVWASIESDVATSRLRSNIDGWMQLVRTGGQPKPNQLVNMLDGLKSTKPTVRGLCDSMLRSYVADPPSVDPNASAEKMLDVFTAYQQQLAKE
ncbi:hypothetical protein [Rubripirellula reticaptiva]|uniref:Uncharacterized protein n=1 Tax=Rubripirellula reticaptiva TaxID=2528013 RepID=A0A5C6EJ44_9BACT|nr:hypothetical protein [Rubripirellula reticaptiva]TWU49773.1 hypothetical protein Poly59_43980 [Rubripirellula reticaptiva]